MPELKPRPPQKQSFFRRLLMLVDNARTPFESACAPVENARTTFAEGSLFKDSWLLRICQQAQTLRGCSG
jgi:hypothetical protein